jgi:hypothetical protein
MMVSAIRNSSVRIQRKLCRRKVLERRTHGFALVAACLKHSIAGDFNLVSVAQVEELLAGRGFAVRRLGQLAGLHHR